MRLRNGDIQQKSTMQEASHFKRMVSEETDSEDENFLYKMIRPIDGIKKSDLVYELDEALQDALPYVVIDYPDVGKEATYAIKWGNFFHKFSVICGVFTFSCGLIKIKVADLSIVPFGIMSSLGALTYNYCWASDPLSQYQIVRPERYALDAPIFDQQLCSQGQVILIRRNDEMRRKLHNNLSVMALCYVLYKIWSRSN